MTFVSTCVDGAWLISPDRHTDKRGFFARSFCRNEFEEHGMNPDVAQCNISYNALAGTLRGMHSQASGFEEDKLVRCTRGAIFDVIVDLRPDSPSYMKHYGAELTDTSRQMLYIPKGVYHGFLTLRDDTEVFYQMSEFFVPGKGLGIRWNDPALGIDWPGQVKVISEKDSSYPDYTPIRP